MIPITFHYNFVGEKTIYYIIGIGVIGIGIGRYENYYIGILSVSADIEKSLSVVHCFWVLYAGPYLHKL